MLVATISVPLSLALLVWFILFFVIAYRVGRRAIGNSSRQLNEERAKLTGLYADVIGNIRAMRLFANQHSERVALMRQAAKVAGKARYTYLGTISVRFVSQLMVLSTWAGLLGFGLYGWARGTVTVGELAMLSTIAILFLQRATDLAESLPDIVDNFAAAQDSAKTLFATPLPQDAAAALPLQVTAGAITIDRLNFAYGEGAAIFQDFSLNIPAGQRVGLIGPSGAGKSTLINLLLRLYEPQGGRIAIDGQVLAAVTADSLYRAVAVIPQDSQLFHRTIAENIRYGRLDATDAEVREAARLAEADGFIEALPQGYDSLVGERGVKLSGGQRQRIAIARAFIKAAPLLILDEPTSALDSESEGAIQRSLATLMQGRTTIVIAHRLSTIAHLNRIVVLDQGPIVEDGSHAALLAQGGLYARLWRMQTEGFIGAG